MIIATQGNNFLKVIPLAFFKDVVHFSYVGKLKNLSRLNQSNSADFSLSKRSVFICKVDKYKIWRLKK